MLTGFVLIAGTMPVYAQPSRGIGGSKPRLDVGYIQDDASFDGAGCSLWFRADKIYTNGRNIFVSDYNEHALMHVDGRDTPLALVKSYEPDGEVKKGLRSTYIYRGDGIDVVIKYVVVGVCAPDDESCEVTQMDAVVSVTARRGKARFRAHGICGT